jgi:hypothetical protein
VYATVAFCHQRICKADIAPVDVSEACRERGIKTVAVSAGYITLFFGRFGFYVACAIAASARRVICAR